MSASFLRAADLRTADLADSDTHHATATTVGCPTLYELPHTLIEQVLSFVPYLDLAWQAAFAGSCTAYKTMLWRHASVA